MTFIPFRPPCFRESNLSKFLVFSDYTLKEGLDLPFVGWTVRVPLYAERLVSTLNGL